MCERRAQPTGRTVNSNLKGWLFVIMRNAWLNQVRHKNSGPLFVDLETNEQSIGESAGQSARCLSEEAGTRAGARSDREFA